MRRSRVVVQHCSIWVSESQSCHLHVAALVVILPSHHLCQVVVLTAMVLVVFMDPFLQMHYVSASFIWQDFTGWFWFLLDRLMYCWNLLVGIVNIHYATSSRDSTAGCVSGFLIKFKMVSMKLKKCLLFSPDASVRSV